MSGLFEENWETYGGSIDRVTEGVWSAVAFAALEVPPWEAQGRYWFTSKAGTGVRARATLGADVAGVGFFCLLHIPQLPDSSESMAPIEFADADNTRTFRLYITATGEISVRNNADTQVAITGTQPIKPGTTHKIQAQIVYGNTDGQVEIRVDNNVVLDTAASLVLPGTAAIFRHGPSPQFFNYWSKSVAVYSLTGTYNNNWPDIAGVFTSLINEDTEDDGLTPRPRQMIGEAVLRIPASGSLLDCAIDNDFLLGAGDYTLEGYFRFDRIPTTTQFFTLFARWSASTSQRSYRLRLNGPAEEAGGLQFEYTTDGTLGTRTVVHDVQWLPAIGHVYHIAVVREDGESRLFIDGVQQGLPVADTATYFAANAKFTVGGEISGTGTVVLANSSLVGQVDEIRVTPGVARYAANFTPTGEAFPRSVVDGDPDFASVTLLAGFEEGVLDESSRANVITVRGLAARYVPDDAGAAYQSAGTITPLDDRFLEAALIPASNILTLTALPTDGETVTIAGQVYTFNTVLGGADSILIGADVAETLQNLDAAIDGEAGEGTTYGTGTVPNVSVTASAGVPTGSQLTAFALTPGVAGNALTASETLANGSWTGGTFSGGQDLPPASTFGIQSPPRTATGVRWIGVRHRSDVDVGTGEIRVDFGVNETFDNGTPVGVSDSGKSYYVERFEEDPDTVSALSVNSIVNGFLRIQRTE